MGKAEGCGGGRFSVVERGAGTEEEAVYQHAAKLLTDPAAYEAMAKAVNPYGDGQACRRIVDAILWNAGLRNQRPEEFLV